MVCTIKPQKSYYNLNVHMAGLAALKILTSHHFPLPKHILSVKNEACRALLDFKIALHVSQKQNLQEQPTFLPCTCNT